MSWPSVGREHRVGTPASPEPWVHTGSLSSPRQVDVDVACPRGRMAQTTDGSHWPGVASDVAKPVNGGLSLLPTLTPESGEISSGTLLTSD